MSGDLSIQKVYVVGTGEAGSSSSVEATGGKNVSVYGTKIVQDSGPDFSPIQLSDSPGKEAFKHFGKKYDDLAMMDVDNTMAKLQMQLDDFAADYPNTKLPELPKMPEPAKFEKGKDGYQAYKMALMQYENVCSNRIEKASRRALTTTVENAASQTQDVVRSTAKETQMVTISGVEYLAEKIDDGVAQIKADNQESADALMKELKTQGYQTRKTIDKATGKVIVTIAKAAAAVSHHVDEVGEGIKNNTNRKASLIRNRLDQIEDKVDKNGRKLDDINETVKDTNERVHLPETVAGEVLDPFHIFH